MEHSGFPSHETLAAFIDGRLDAQTRKRVIEHMATCSECRSIFVSTNELRGPIAATPRRLSLRWTSAFAAAFLVALILVGGYAISRRGKGHLPSGVEALIADTSHFPNRPTAARVSGFPYRPEEPTFRQGPATNDESTWDAKGAAAAISKRAARHPTVENLHALGISHLAFGNAADAIRPLEDAIRLETGKPDVGAAIDASTDAPLLSDLSAAYFALAQRTEHREARLLSALDAAKRAWDLDPHSPEAAWNRAVCLEAASSSRENAVAAWDDYLRLDPSSDWAKEAKQHRDRLAVNTQSDRWDNEKAKLHESEPDAVVVGSRLAEAFPQEARGLAQDELLPSWADAELAGDSLAATHRLDIIRVIGEAAEARGDTLLARTVAHIESSHDRRRIARGFVAWREAIAAYDAKTMLPAAEAAARAVADLSASGSPFAPAAQHQAARVDFNRNDYDAVFVRLRTISPADLEASHWLRGKVLWLTGLTESVLGRPKQALDNYDRAFDAFKKADEKENQLAVVNLMAIDDGYAADNGRAWQRRFDALQMLRDLGHSRRAAYILADASRTAAQEGHRGAALLFADEMLHAAKLANDPVTLSEAYLNRGLACHLSGADQQARVELAHADHWAARIPSEEIRARTMANTELTAFDWRGHESPDVEMRRLDGVINFFVSTGKQYNLAQLFFLRARVACAAGRAVPCETDFKTGLGEAAKELRVLDDPVLFGTYLTKTREATNGVASLLVKRNDAKAALPYIDCNRLLFSAANAQPTACAESLMPLVGAVQRRLPARAGLLELAVVDGQLLTWLITPERLQFEQRPMDARNAAKLLEPFTMELRELEALVIVSDPAMPEAFSSLRNPVTQSFLIQDVRLSFQPSAATFAASARPVPPRGGALIVCNAAYDESAVPGLKPLAQANEESTVVAAAYGAPEVLRGRDATPRRFLAAAGDAAIVHYVGHATSPPDAPLLAALVLAPDGRDSGLLFARDIARAKFRRTSLVVLSACSTAAAARHQEAGVTNLASAFLAAGVPGVIASTTPVDDTTAPELFRQLHLQLARGVAPAEALQKAQIEMIRRGAPPFAWAGFQYLGSI
ncbi:MAG TPA: CHAT domain-containing protein [Thermoanaerobaculia bacterium]|jgi:tetratricopeptide (TPR) repeat protein|nr:CHAT domain-containing protein [Thermoanaerobaculia bacterium]